MHPDGADAHLSFVDLDFDPADPGFEAVSSRLTCLSRNYNGDLVIDPAWGELEMESGTLVPARCLSKPTKTIPAPSGGGLQWRLISHLASNHLSLVKGGRDALREILMLYKPGKEGGAERPDEPGILGLSSKPAVASIPSEHGIVFAMGIDVGLQLSEEHFADTGLYLFSSVLDRFLGLYSAIKLVHEADGKQQKGGMEVVATPSRRKSPSIKDQLFSARACEFEFFQAVRLPV